VQSLDEWCFEFVVAAMTPIPRSVIDALLDEAMEWAEARALGIGGGYRPVTPEVAAAATTWRFQFGLCIQASDLLIPDAQAAELCDLLRTWCNSRRLSYVGGFRPYSPAERGQEA
jgi:hypothetical protein